MSDDRACCDMKKLMSSDWQLETGGSWLSQDDTLNMAPNTELLERCLQSDCEIARALVRDCYPRRLLFYKKSSLVQSKLAHACSIVAVQQYMHAQPISGLMTGSIYEYMVPAAMCLTNM